MVSRGMFLGFLHAPSETGLEQGLGGTAGTDERGPAANHVSPGVFGAVLSLWMGARGGLGVMGVQGVMGHVSCLPPLQHQRCPWEHPVRGVTLSHRYWPPRKGRSQGVGEELGLARQFLGKDHVCCNPGGTFAWASPPCPKIPRQTEA